MSFETDDTLYYSPYKQYDSILNNKAEKFEVKVESLIEVWKSISELSFSEFDTKFVIQIIDWAKLHALNIVLTGEWGTTKESFRHCLLDYIQKAQSSLASINSAFSNRFQKLADVVKNPWEDPVLSNLIRDKDVEIGSKEIEFFFVETGYLVSFRLRKLCESHCEDLALNLVTNFLKYKQQAANQNSTVNATETQLWFIFDINIALLYKFHNEKKIKEHFEAVELPEGVQLIKRFAKKRVKMLKIWRNCLRIAIFGCKFFLAKALLKYTSDIKDILVDLLKTYLSLSNSETLLEEFIVSVRDLTKLADAESLCVLCDIIHQEAAEKLRLFLIECYIRALTAEMNEIEQLKDANDEENVKSANSRLAKMFSDLSNLLDDHVKTARECILTAFSIEPTKERLQRIEDLAKRSGFPVLDTGQKEWKCRLHPPILPTDEVTWMCNECGDYMCEPKLTAPLQMNTPLQDALQPSDLGISVALCDDLVVCLSNPRYQILTWGLAWEDLYRLCVMYLNDPEKTKNFVTELKFVQIDYSAYQHIKKEPVDEFAGIEKGYEQYLDLDFEDGYSLSEDSTSRDGNVGLGSDGTGDAALPKSDPKTLQSLRMFRPNTKRKRDKVESTSKEKKMAYNPGSSSVPSGSQSLPSTLRPGSSACSSNLGNGASTDYVPHINKSNMPFDVPKPSTSSGHFSVPVRTARKHSQVIVQKHKPSTVKTVQAPRQPVASSISTELDAILREVVNDIDNDTITVSEPKNVVAATLPQLGGQVANQPQLSTPVKQPETSSPNGTNDACKTTIRKEVKVSGINSDHYQHHHHQQHVPPKPQCGHSTFPIKLKELIISMPKEDEELIQQAKRMHLETSSKACQDLPVLPDTPAERMRGGASPRPRKCKVAATPSPTDNREVEKGQTYCSRPPSIPPSPGPDKTVTDPKTHNTNSTTTTTTTNTSCDTVNPRQAQKRNSVHIDSNCDSQPKVERLKFYPPATGMRPSDHTIYCRSSIGEIYKDVAVGVLPVDMLRGFTILTPMEDDFLGVRYMKKLASDLFSRRGERRSLKIRHPITCCRQRVVKAALKVKMEERLAAKKRRRNRRPFVTESRVKRPVRWTKGLLEAQEHLDDMFTNYNKACEMLRVPPDNNLFRHLPNSFLRAKNLIRPRRGYFVLHIPSPRLKTNEAQSEMELTVPLIRLPEVIARPNVKVLVSNPFDNEETSTDPIGEVGKKLTPLLDSKQAKKRVDQQVDSKVDKCSKSPDRRRFHVRIYEDNFYSMVAKTDQPPERFRVPGLNDYSHILPRHVDHVVNVLEHSGTMPAAPIGRSAPQTSTQVTAHIQRIGQPKMSAGNVIDDGGRKISGSSIGRPPAVSLFSVLEPENNMEQEYGGIIFTQKDLVPPSELDGGESEGTLTVSKCDTEDPKESANSLSKNVQVLTTSITTTTTTTTSTTVTTTASQVGAVSTCSSTPVQTSTILQVICKSSSLPKFQQAFGKTVYQAGGNFNENSSENNGETSSNNNQTTIVEAKKVTTKTIPIIQPISGNVIIKPSGQTVSLIPPSNNSCKQILKITSPANERISLVKEGVFQNKMSALLAAALQGKTKVSEQNGKKIEEFPTTITLCKPGTIPLNATRIVKPVQLQIPASVVRTPQTNVSSSTLEQLREFDMVFKQVQERSSSNTQPEVNSQNKQDSPQQQQRISFINVNQVQKLTPVVVVSSYSSIQQQTPPLTTVTTSQVSVVTQSSTVVTLPKVAVKTSKGKVIKSSSAKTSPTTVPIPKPQQKPQEDEHTTQRIFNILQEYAEQLRNSPDLNNKPAPRRRSNPPTNPNSTSSSSSGKKKKKKSNANNQVPSNWVETDNEDLTMCSEDSSGGNMVQLSMTDEEQSQSATNISPPDSNIEAVVQSSNPPTPRPLIIADASNQTRNVIIADSSVGEALKVTPNSTLLMPANYVMPLSVVKGGQPIAVVSGGSKILTAVPARSGQNMLLVQSFLNQNKKGTSLAPLKYSTLQPFTSISCQTTQSPIVLPSTPVATVALSQPITLKKVEDGEKGSNAEFLFTISQPREVIKIEKSPDVVPQPDSSTHLSSETIEVKIEERSPDDCKETKNVRNQRNNNSIATSVIASVIKKEPSDVSDAKGAPTTIKVEGSKQSGRTILVDASSITNGPMLSHTNAKCRTKNESVVESTSASNKEFKHNAVKAPPQATRIFKNNAIYYTIRAKKTTNKKIDSEIQRQAAMEREMRLQKTLSEECEDLGVDEPSTSDLFPEADLMFDASHSPSYEQKIHGIEIKHSAAHLFSDDDNSSPLRSDLFDYVEYRPTHQCSNNASNESASSGDDSTLLTNCGSMSEVTLNSPILPEYSNNSYIINKYKYKYTNRKKIIKLAQNWPTTADVTSSGSILEIVKEEETPIAIQEETVIDETIEEVVEEETEEDEEETAGVLKIGDVVGECPVHTKNFKHKKLKRACNCYSNGSRNKTTVNRKQLLVTAKKR